MVDLDRPSWSRQGSQRPPAPQKSCCGGDGRSAATVLCEEVRAMREFSWRPWARLARHVHCRYIAGTHLGAITTHVAELARLPDDLLCPQQVDHPARTTNEAPASRLPWTRVA